MTNTINKIGASVDAITRTGSDTFSIRLIPDYKSEYVRPFHTRYVSVSGMFLEKEFLSWINEHHQTEYAPTYIDAPTGAVIQGGYYIFSKQDFNRMTTSSEILNEDDIRTFSTAQHESPYREPELESLTSNQISYLNTGPSPKDSAYTYLYGLNVGQGDMLLLITSSRNAYIIDTNLTKDNIHKKACEIKSILRYHQMDEKKLKGLIITHKHLDHIRGAAQLINEGIFSFDNLLMNFDYSHQTPVVTKFLEAVQKNVHRLVNVNNPCNIDEGITYIGFKNPSSLTREAPDINDSSIVMCIGHGGEYGAHLIYLTGDASTSILEKSLAASQLDRSYDNVIKVSHHGSITGISHNLLRMITPTKAPAKAFISVGSSRKYNHPHKECERLLKSNRVKTSISRNVMKTVEYCCDCFGVGVRLV